LAIKNKLLALAPLGLNELGFEVWFWKWCGLDQCFPSVFRIIAKFPWRKSGNISPYICCGNPPVLCLELVSSAS